VTKGCAFRGHGQAAYQSTSPYLLEDVGISSGSETILAFLPRPQAMSLVMESPKVGDLNAADFDAVFLPGGHGACFDLPVHPGLLGQLSAAYESGKVLAAVW